MFGQCFHNISADHGLVFSLFLAGLFGGFTHCLAMCGPFVIAQSESFQGAKLARIGQASLWPYHLGRMTTYVLFAFLFSTILSVAFLYMPVKSMIVVPLLLLSSLIFLVNALPGLLNLFPWVSKIHLGVPFSWIKKMVRGLIDSPQPFKRYLLGIFLGFMPCGLVVAALMASSSASSPWLAGAAMAAFSVGTVPALVGVALGGQALQEYNQTLFIKVRQAFMVCSSLWLFILAITMVN